MMFFDRVKEHAESARSHRQFFSNRLNVSLNMLVADDGRDARPVLKLRTLCEEALEVFVPSEKARDMMLDDTSTEQHPPFLCLPKNVFLPIRDNIKNNISSLCARNYMYACAPREARSCWQCCRQQAAAASAAAAAALAAAAGYSDLRRRSVWGRTVQWTWEWTRLRKNTRTA